MCYRLRTGDRGMVTLLIMGLASGAAGCGRRSSLMLQRQARGPLVEEQAVAQPVVGWTLEPVSQTKTQSGIDVTVTYASPRYLHAFFSDKQAFGSYAGMNPYFPEQLIFYLKVSNGSGKKIRFDPADFVLLDDLGNQYTTMNIDAVTALAESKAPVSTFTRGVINEARPGYFGVGLPVGKIIGGSQQRFALLSLASLQAGYLYPGVTYDGLIAFWSPSQRATRLKLLITNVKTDFTASESPQTALEFTVEFTINRQSH